MVTAIFAFYLIRFTDVKLTLAGTFQSWILLEYRLGGSTAFICSGDRYGKRCQLYRWSGWSGIQRNRNGGNILYGSGSGNTSGIEPITCAVVGALMGFLLFNVFPAKVFMGDTGSLALEDLLQVLLTCCRCRCSDSGRPYLSD